MISYGAKNGENRIQSFTQTRESGAARWIFDVFSEESISLLSEENTRKGTDGLRSILVRFFF